MRRICAMSGLLVLSGMIRAAEPPAAVCGFRGDGTATYAKADPLTEWGDKKNVKWKATVGNSFSSLVVCGDCVFVTANPPSLFCLNAATGAQKWKAALGASDLPAEFKDTADKGENAPSTCGLAAPTPVCDGKHVFAIFGNGVIACYTLDGKREWLQCHLSARSQYGHSSSPLLAEGKLLVNLANLAALDPATGKTLWECKDAGQYYGTPICLKLGETAVLVTPLGLVVRVKDGKVLAKGLGDGLGGDEYGISPTAGEGIVYIGDRNITAVKLDLKGDSVETKNLWSADMDESAFATPLAAGGFLYVIGKRAHYCVLDLATGNKVVDQILKLAPAGGEDMEHSNANVYPSIVLAGKRLFVGNDIGQTFVLEPGKEYKEVARNRLEEGSGGTPVFSGTSMFTRAGDDVLCIGK